MHELIEEYEADHKIVTVDYTNAFNTPNRIAIAETLQKHDVFRPFMRLFFLEYSEPSDLLFFADNTLYSTIKSTSGVRQGSALSSLYFCSLIHPILAEVADLFPEVTIRAYMDDITLSSRNTLSLEAAFLHLQELSKDLSLDVNCNKTEWFQKGAKNCPLALQKAGLSSPEKSVKILGAYIGENEDVSEKLVRQSVKHVCLF